MTWSKTILQTLKDNDVRLVAYVPDNVLTPLLKGVTADNYFMAVVATREDEALGIVAGAWMVAVTHHTLTDTTTLRFMLDKSIKQAVSTPGPGGADPLAAAHRRTSGGRREAARMTL